jgi:hypothetical protein
LTGWTSRIFSLLALQIRDRSPRFDPGKRGLAYRQGLSMRRSNAIEESLLKVFVEAHRWIALSD